MNSPSKTTGIRHDSPSDSLAAEGGSGPIAKDSVVHSSSRLLGAVGMLLVATACGGDLGSSDDGWGSPVGPDGNDDTSTASVGGNSDTTGVPGGSTAGGAVAPVATDPVTGEPVNDPTVTDSVNPTAGDVSPSTADVSPDATDTGSPDQPVADVSETACDELGGQLEAGVTKLRRLTRGQLNNTLRDLLGIADNPAGGLSPDAAVGPFENNAFNPATELVVEQHEELAVRAAESVVSRMNDISPCDLAADTTTACATQFAQTFGQKAYRRPLEADEVSAYVSLFELGRTEADAANGFRLMVTAMLQSPFFLYHWDVGASGTPTNGVVPVTSWELASRLSYFLWNSMPDDALFAAAADNSLLQDAVIEQQITRMLDDSRAADSIKLFHLQWLKVYDLSRVEKDTALFPAFNEGFLSSMQNETANFTDYVVRKGDGLMSTLLTADWSILDPTMAQVYGVTATSTSEPTMLSAEQRAGVLTQAAFLARHAHREDTSPVHRGITVRENILCNTIPDPPQGVSTTLPDPALATSTRERFSMHLADASCAGCHELMDPVGLSFEHYDAVGAWRETDRYGAVDASGEVVRGQDSLAGEFYGAVELSQRLAQSQDVAECLTNQWFRFALGRMESDLDACTIQNLRAEFAASGNHVPTLIKSIVKSDAFLNVRATAE